MSYLTLTFDCFCGRTYGNSPDLEAHRRARGHFSSHKCGHHCKHPRTAQNPVRIQFCNHCGKKCERDDILQDHRTITGHCFCSECDRVFDSQEALQKHLRTQMHASEFRCCNCNIEFKDIHALNAHMASRAHRKPLPATKKTPKSLTMTSTNEKLPCKDCKRTFASASALHQHQASVRHKPLSNLICPLGKDCTVRFTSPSALIQHLESGGCNSKTTRDQIHRLIQSYDSEGLIHSLSESTPPTPRSFPSPEPSLRDRLPRTPDLVSDNSSWSFVMSPSILSLKESVTGGVSLVSGLPTPRSDDQHSVDVLVSHQFGCPLCPLTRKVFATAQDLENHMSSPVHCPKIYHCPTDMFSEVQSSRPQKQPKLFSTLGGLAQHLESGACQGGKETFHKIVGFIEQRLELLGFKSMPLLLAGYRGGLAGS